MVCVCVCVCVQMYSWSVYRYVSRVCRCTDGIHVCVCACTRRPEVNLQYPCSGFVPIRTMAAIHRQSRFPSSGLIPPVFGQWARGVSLHSGTHFGSLSLLHSLERSEIVGTGPAECGKMLTGDLRASGDSVLSGDTQQCPSLWNPC